MLLRIRTMIWKEFLQISRDARTLGIVIVMPAIMLLLYGYAINLDVRHVALSIYDQDGSRQSRDLIGQFTRGGYFDAVAYLHDEHAVTEQLDGGHTKVVLVIPATYSRDLANNRVTQVQLLVDGSDSTTASTAIGYLGIIVQQQSLRIAVQAMRISNNGLLPIDLRSRYWYNPELRSTNFIIPGLMAVLLMMLAALITSSTVVRERERGTIEQLIVSPVKPFEIMAGKLIPYVIIAFGDVLLVLVVSRLIFRIPLVGGPVLVLFFSAIFLVAALGIGLFISTTAPTQQVAVMIAFMATQLPSVLLSGFMFPISSMPKAVQILTNIIPAAHFIRILRAVFLKGSGLALLWKPTLFLLFIGALMLTLSSLRFKKKL